MISLDRDRSPKNSVPKTLSSLLDVRGGDDATTFYQQAFGVEARFRVDDADVHVVPTLGVHKIEFGISDEFNPGPATINGPSARIMLITDDPDALSHKH